MRFSAVFLVTDFQISCKNFFEMNFPESQICGGFQAFALFSLLKFGA
jgi:hypothetical protein